METPPERPRGLIDIHCHLLPGLDDGPRSFGASLQMCALARAAGTVAVAATPHASYRFPYDPRKTAERCAQLQRQAPPPLRVFVGCELEVSLEALPAALANPGRYTLNASRYLLLELMPAGVPPNLERVFAGLLDRGFTPILAHPERCVPLWQQWKKLSGWVTRGCLVQLTGDALTGRRGPRARAAALELLRRRLAHFVASDGHDPLRRPPRLIDAYRAVGESISPALADLLCISNPRAVLENRPIQAWPAF